MFWDLARGEAGFWVLIFTVGGDPSHGIPSHRVEKDGRTPHGPGLHVLQQGSPAAPWGFCRDLGLNSSSFPAGVTVELLKWKEDKQLHPGELSLK